MVIGISSGVGKSTFARKLGEALNITVYHLDAFYWKPGWVEASLEEFSKAQQEIVSQPQWIIEGNYNTTFEIRAEHADTIIYLELPLRVCLYRVVKRWLMNIGRTRADLGEGCKEKLDWKFIKFIYTTYYPRKKKMNERFQAFQAVGTKKEIITLKSKQEIHSYIEKIQSKMESAH
jgi:adenylate kinase family enzyme